MNTSHSRLLLAAFAILVPAALSAQPAENLPPPTRDPSPSPAQEQPPSPAPADQPDDNLEAQQSALQRELDRAQETLEQAARDVARLSAELAGPVVDEVARQFRTVRPRAMLGLNIEDGERGVRVVGVSPNGPAASAGIRTGDLVVAVDSERLDAESGPPPSRRLLRRMGDIEPGEDVRLVIRRGADESDVTVTARDFDLFGPQMRIRSDRSRFGAAAFGMWRTMELAPLTPDLGRYFGTEQGLLVVQAPEDDALGLRDGDVILDIGGREPTSPEHAMRILNSFYPGETLRVTVMRNQRRETLELELPEE